MTVKTGGSGSNNINYILYYFPIIGQTCEIMGWEEWAPYGLIVAAKAGAIDPSGLWNCLNFKEKETRKKTDKEMVIEMMRGKINKPWTEKKKMTREDFIKMYSSMPTMPVEAIFYVRDFFESFK